MVMKYFVQAYVDKAEKAASGMVDCWWLSFIFNQLFRVHWFGAMAGQLCEKYGSIVS
jgi:hypothetical protein